MSDSKLFNLNFKESISLCTKHRDMDDKHEGVLNFVSDFVTWPAACFFAGRAFGLFLRYGPQGSGILFTLKCLTGSLIATRISEHIQHDAYKSERLWSSLEKRGKAIETNNYSNVFAYNNATKSFVADVADAHLNSKIKWRNYLFFPKIN